MFPNPPYPGVSWPITQHMGVITPINLYQILWAAINFKDTNDPSVAINDYIVANSLVTPNVRSDSGQVDAWRDYQQILSELGLIFSTEVTVHITPTQLGMAYYDRLLSFSDVITIQALRYQYPNGHKMQVSTALRSMLVETSLAHIRSLAQIQQTVGLLIRPGVLIWNILRELQNRDQDSFLTIDEIQGYLLNCRTHEDTMLCVEAIINSRVSEETATVISTRQRRNVQDWIRYLLLTSIFTGRTGRNAYLQISQFGADNTTQFDFFCRYLSSAESFWQPGSLDRYDRVNWYNYFGSVDLTLPSIPEERVAEEEEVYVLEEERDNLEANYQSVGEAAGAIELREFNVEQAESDTEESYQQRTIASVYDSGLTDRARLLHGQMVVYLYQICADKGALIFEDPGSIDLLVQYEGTEFIIEVKSITSRNFVKQLRYALGQLFHYDYLRASQASLPRRRIIAITANISRDSWCISFLNEYLDIDLLAFDGSILHVYTQHEPTIRLFEVPT